MKQIHRAHSYASCIKIMNGMLIEHDGTSIMNTFTASWARVVDDLHSYKWEYLQLVVVEVLAVMIELWHDVCQGIDGSHVV